MGLLVIISFLLIVFGVFGSLFALITFNKELAIITVFSFFVGFMISQSLENNTNSKNLID